MIFQVEPCPKPRMTRSDKWKTRPPVVRYRIYASSMKHYAAEAGYVVPDTLSITFVIPMPKSWSKKKREEMDGKPHQQKPDLDNLIKAFKDSLCADDSHVHTYGEMRKVWGVEGKILVH